MQHINDTMFAFVIVTILLIAITVPITLNQIYDPSRKYAGYEKRDILHLKPDSELRLLPCIHGLRNINPMINLLDKSCPTRESLIAVHALHLIELIGRARPVFISHQIQNRTGSKKRSCSENVIFAFKDFELNNSEAVSINVFTAISPHKLMHEDICTLALNKLSSLIILPFHRVWSIDGTIEVEDNVIRALNRSVLERAPCSVGILVDRGHRHCIYSISLASSSSTSTSRLSFFVVVIYFGGDDDRESLAFAKRMAKNASISLTVIRFIAKDDDGVMNWEKILDSEALKDIKYNNIGVGNIIYIEEKVKDGAETALIIRSLVEEYDLIIVGRRCNVVTPQTSGLQQWSEFPELGIMGDLLASTDLHGKFSVLVVQQQIHMS